MGVVLLVVVLIGALLLSGFCAGSETGYFSLNRGRVLHLVREGSAKAKIVEAALRDRARTLTALLVGNNLGAVTFSSASAALAAHAFPDAEAVVARTVWSLCAACVMLVLGEYLPKLFCSARPLRRMLRLAPCYRVFAYVMRPLTSIALFLTGLFEPKKSGTHERKVTPDDLLQILADRKDGVSVTDFESALIARILVLRKKGETVTPEKLLSALDGPENA